MKTIVLASGAILLIFVSWIYMAQPRIMGQPDSRRVVAVDVNALRDHVETLALSIGHRSFAHPAGLDAAAAYIQSVFAWSGGLLSEQAYEVPGSIAPGGTSSPVKVRNLIVSFGPREGDRILIGAHYDTFGATPGADDNASGVAGLLELAKLLGKNPPPIRVDLIAWTLEEPPAFGTPDMGSAYHAASLVKEKINVRAAISLEMIGYYTDSPKSQSYPMPLLSLFYPSTGNFIAVVGGVKDRALAKTIKESIRGTVALPVVSLNAPGSLWGIGDSDHRSYWPCGIASVMVTDTAFLRNPHYHKATDTPETLDYARMAQVVQGVYAALRDLAHPPDNETP